MNGSLLQEVGSDTASTFQVGKSCAKTLNDLPEVAQRGRDRTGVRAQAAWLQGLCSYQRTTPHVKNVKFYTITNTRQTQARPVTVFPAHTYIKEHL